MHALFGDTTVSQAQVFKWDKYPMKMMSNLHSLQPVEVMNQ